MSDTGNHVLRIIFDDGRTETWAGDSNHEPRWGFKDGPRLQALFDKPKGMAITWDGVVLVADSTNNRVRQIDGDEVSTLAGTGEYSQGSQQDCPADLASFRSPIAVGIDHQGNVIVCEESPRDDEIRVIIDTGYAPALHHREHQMTKVIDKTAMDIVKAVTDKCELEICRDFGAICETALLSLGVSNGARQSGRELMHDDEFSGLSHAHALFCTRRYTCTL